MQSKGGGEARMMANVSSDRTKGGQVCPERVKARLLNIMTKIFQALSGSFQKPSKTIPKPSPGTGRPWCRHCSPRRPMLVQFCQIMSLKIPKQVQRWPPGTGRPWCPHCLPKRPIRVLGIFLPLAGKDDEPGAYINIIFVIFSFLSSLSFLSF